MIKSEKNMKTYQGSSGMETGLRLSSRVARMEIYLKIFAIFSNSPHSIQALQL